MSAEALSPIATYFRICDGVRVEADLHAETSAAVRARLSESEFNRCFDEGAKSDIYAAIDTGLAALRMLD